MDARYSDDILPKNIKKVELHVHQDTCLSLHYIKQVCPGITLEDFTMIFIAPTKCGDLAHFLRKVAPLADFYRCSEHALETSFIDNETQQRVMRGAE